MALLETLRILNSAEQEAFRLFLRSPFFTASVRNHKPENLLGLLEFLLEQAPAGEEDSFDKVAVYTLLFPEKKFAEATINALSSELHRLLKDFLKIKTAAEAPEAASLIWLARFYRKRNLEKDFLKTMEQLLRALDDTPPADRDVEFYNLCYEANYEICDFKSTRNTKSGDIHLLETIQSLDVFFAFAKLRYTAHLLHQRQMVSLDGEEVIPVAEIAALAETSPLLDLPVIRCFQKAVETMLAADADAMMALFSDYQVFLQRYASVVPPERLNGLLAMERSICSRLYQSGRVGMLERLFELYQRHLTAGFLYQEGGLNPAVFQNIVRAGLKLGQADWVERFLAEHPPSRIVFCQNPEDVYRFNLASFYFQKKDFSRTLQCLQQRYEDNYYVLDANLLELKLYYERHNWILLLNKLNSFKVNLFKKSRQWLPAPRHEAISRFIDLVRQMIHDRIQLDRNPAAIEKLRQKMQGLPALAEREWLLEKLDEVAKK